MKKTFEGLNKKKLLGVLALFAVLSGTMVASVPNVAADTTTSILSIVKNIQTIVTSIKTIVQNTNTNLNKVKVETVIQGPWINTSGFNFPGFNITANQPWDLMTVYISTKGVTFKIEGNVTRYDELVFGEYFFGSRIFFGNITVAKFEDATGFPLFPGDMTEKTQSIIAVAANESVAVSANTLGEVDFTVGFLVSFKILIQRPIDPAFCINVNWEPVV